MNGLPAAYPSVSLGSCGRRPGVLVGESRRVSTGGEAYCEWWDHGLSLAFFCAAVFLCRGVRILENATTAKVAPRTARSSEPAHPRRALNQRSLNSTLRAPLPFKSGEQHPIHFAWGRASNFRALTTQNSHVRASSASHQPER